MNAPTAAGAAAEELEPARAPVEPMSGPAVLGAVVCAALWGGNSVAVKLSLPAFPPLLVAGLRFGLALFVSGGWGGWNGWSFRVSRAPRAMVLANGLLLYLQIATFTIGTAWSTSVHSVLLINVYPFFTAILSRYLLPDHPIRRAKAWGLLIAFAGVLVTLMDDLVLESAVHPAGDLLLVFSAAVLGLKVTYVKSLLGRIDVFRLVFWEAAIAAPLFLLTSALFEGVSNWGFTWPALAAVLYQAWAVSAVAFLWWTHLLGRHSANDLAAYSFLTPAFGMALGWALLGEPLTPAFLAGALLITLGIRQITLG